MRRLVPIACAAALGCGPAPRRASAAAQPQIPVSVMFVDGSASRARADGTREHPFATIGDALKVAPAGALVRVAEGTYAETVEVRANVTINGAGAAKTRIVGNKAMHGPLVRVGADRVELSD